MENRLLKLCRVCNDEELHSVNKAGRCNTWCMKCQREYSRRHYDIPENGSKAKDRTKTRNKIYRETNRSIIRQHKNVPCMDCSNSYPYYVMHFDHRNPKDKSFTIGNSNQLNISYEELKKELAKCDVVCANCHAERTYGQRS